MTKAVKEFLLDHGTGEVNVEYSDNTTTSFNLANAVTVTESAQGVVKYSAGDTPVALAESKSQSCAQILLAPSGAFTNTSGAFALGTALSYTPAGSVYMYLPTGAGGLAGGTLYECAFSSTTVGQVVGAPVTTVTAWTQQTTAATLYSAVLPAMSVGSGDSLDLAVVVGCNNSAGSKSVVASLGGASVLSQSLTTAQSGVFAARVAVMTPTTQVRAGLVGIDSASTNALGQMSVNLAADQSIAVTGQLAVATDWLLLQLVRPTIYRG